MRLLDANMILRYLLADDAEQSQAARILIEEDQSYSYPEVLAEVVYVLSGVYGLGRAEISDAFRRLAQWMFFYDLDMLITAFNYYELTTMDFVDCLLAARCLCLEEPVASFDKQLNKFIGKAVPATSEHGAPGTS